MTSITTVDPSNYDVFVGLDVDKTSFAVTYKTKETNSYKSLKMPADPKAVKSYFNNRFENKRLLFAYEAGPTGYGLYDYLTSQDLSCMMVHPGNIQKAPKDRVKTNRLDSLKITKQLQSGELKGIRVPDDIYRQLRHLTLLRQQYAQDQRRAIQKLKAFLLFENIKEGELLGPGRPSGMHIRTLKELPLDPARKFKVDNHLEDLVYARKKLLSVHRALRLFLKENPEIENYYRLLTSIPGFGLVTSLYFLGRVGDPKNLHNVREIGSFVGVVPSEKSTGEDVNKGSITHTGDSTLRSLLVEAAWMAIRKDKELNFFYHRIKARRGEGKGSKIAIVAVARKLTARAHNVLKEKRPYIVR